MATRNIKDAKDLTTGELIYFKGHAQATFMSDGRTVEEAVSEMSAVDTSNLATKDELAQKQDIISDIDTIRNNAANYKGTVTSVKINGTNKNPSNGVIDLGTVITAHQDISGKVDKTLNAKAFEGIYIQTTNSAADKAANVAAIKAYVDNLKTLGVDTTKILSIPVRTGIDSIGNLMYRGTDNYFSLTGMVFGFNDMEINYVYIGNDGSYSKFLGVYDEDGLETVRKNIVGAINEVNTLAKSKGNGTITEVRMNGASKGTSGVVDLGTVLTEHQPLKTINGETITGSGNINIAGGNTEIDTSMSDTSTNPVQNKVIKAYIDGLVGNVAARLAQI